MVTAANLTDGDAVNARARAGRTRRWRSVSIGETDAREKCCRPAYRTQTCGAGGIVSGRLRWLDAALHPHLMRRKARERRRARVRGAHRSHARDAARRRGADDQSAAAGELHAHRVFMRSPRVGVLPREATGATFYVDWPQGQLARDGGPGSAVHSIACGASPAHCALSPSPPMPLPGRGRFIAARRRTTPFQRPKGRQNRRF